MRCDFLFWNDFNLVLEGYVSVLMAFREYGTCGFGVIFFLPRQRERCLRWHEGAEGEEKNNVLRASSLEFALSTKCGHVEMWICGPG